jgi:RHS repeat-associated protein
VWLADIPVATLRPGGSSVAIYYVQTDQLDTPRAVIRPSDNTQMWTWYAGPFGSEAPNTNPQGIGTFSYDLRFAGQIAGSWGSTYQNYFRDYDPTVGRFVESDPTGLKAGSYSTYSYVSDDPIDYADPLGLCKVVLEFSRVMLNAYHISVYTSDPSGNMWFAGGPTTHLSPDPRAADDVSTGTPWGFLWGSHGTTKSVPTGPDTRVVVDDRKPCSCYNSSFEGTIQRVNANSIVYNPLDQNRNSLAGTMLSDAGVSAPDTWSYWTPAYSNNLNNYLHFSPPPEFPSPP